LNKERGTSHCPGGHIDPANLERIRSSLDALPHVAEVFNALGDNTRIRILYALRESELCVCELASLLDLTPQAVSYHLRLLRVLRLVKYRKEGKTVFYSLDDEHIVLMLQQALDHLTHN
jgi:DNA-binding transcriptional ArsR family regulator